jgi:putative SOS response-associated peptidase YedK
MCGRFDIHSAIEIITKIFQIDSVTFGIKPSYNVAPGQDVAIVMNDGKNRLITSKWGFVPSWSKEPKTGYKMINARAETVATNKSFKNAFENHLCPVVADGFFEWKKEGAVKKPYYIHLKSGLPFGFAGLYNVWTSPEGEQINTCTIITTDANELIAPIHNRMPIIDSPNKYQQWLDPSIHDEKSILAMLKPLPLEELELYPVTSKVNSFKYNNPQNIERIKQ